MLPRSPSPEKKSNLESVLAGRIYTSTSQALASHLQMLQSNYGLTLQDSHNSLIRKCIELDKNLQALKADNTICSNEFRQNLDTALADIETSIDMMQVKIDDNSAFERITFQRMDVYPASYLSMVRDMEGSIQQTIKLFQDYKNVKSLVLHPKRHHMVDAKKIIDFCQLALKNQEWNLDRKITEIRTYLSKMKNGLIGTMEITIDDPSHLSSFLKRLHFALDKLLVSLPPMQIQNESRPAPRRG